MSENVKKQRKVIHEKNKGYDNAEKKEGVVYGLDYFSLIVFILLKSTYSILLFLPFTYHQNTGY